VPSAGFRVSARHLTDRVADRIADQIIDRLRGPLAPPPGPDAVTDGSIAPVDREGLDNAHIELLLGFVLREESNCLDVGANEGRFLHHIHRLAPLGRHIAWEPIPALADQLRVAFPDVDVHNAALFNRAGEREFTLVPEDTGHSGLLERAYPKPYRTEKIRVVVERLDDVLPAGYVPHLIKVDVEGAELQVFEGGSETITRHQPTIVFEHGLGAADRYDTEPEAVHDLLCGRAGLRIFDLDARGPLSRDEFAEVFAAGSRWNFVAHP